MQNRQPYHWLPASRERGKKEERYSDGLGTILYVTIRGIDKLKQNCLLGICVNFIGISVAGSFFQDLIELTEECNRSSACRDNVADRLGQENRKNLVRKEIGQNENQGDQQDDLPQAGQEQTDFCLPQSHKALLAAQLEAKGEDTRHIDPHCPCGILRQRSVIGEHSRKHLRNQQHSCPAKGTEDHTDNKLTPECFLYPLVIMGAEVVADDRLTALANALQRHC